MAQKSTRCRCGSLRCAWKAPQVDSPHVFDAAIVEYARLPSADIPAAVVGGTACYLWVGTKGGSVGWERSCPCFCRATFTEVVFRVPRWLLGRRIGGGVGRISATRPQPTISSIATKRRDRMAQKSTVVKVPYSVLNVTNRFRSDPR